MEKSEDKGVTILRDMLDQNQWETATRLVQCGKFTTEDLTAVVPEVWRGVTMMVWCVGVFTNRSINKPSYTQVLAFARALINAGVDPKTNLNGETAFTLALSRGEYELARELHPLIGHADYTTIKDLESGTLVNIFTHSVGTRSVDETEKMLMWILDLKNSDGSFINPNRKSTWGNEPLKQLRTYTFKKGSKETVAAVEKILTIACKYYK
jgi:hypothetical protein